MVKIMPGFHQRAGAGLAVMGHLRILVELAADAVPAEFADHRVAVLFGMFLDDRADVADAAAGRTTEMPSHRHSKVISQSRLAWIDPSPIMYMRLVSPW
jgi:hypothetical protein